MAEAMIGIDMPDIPVAVVPGHIGTKTPQELRADILDVTLDDVVKNLTVMPAAVGARDEPGARDIVARGGFRAINRYFVEHEYSDGLPIVPPTRDEIEAFLAFTDWHPDESLGTLLPDRRAATVAGLPVENILIARYTPSRYHGLGFGAKFVVAFGASPLAILAIAWVRQATGSLEMLFLALAGISVVITLVALLLPGGDRAREPVLVQPAPAE